MSDERVYGWWVIREHGTNKEIHRIAGHSPKGSPTWERADDGLLRKVDFGRFWLEWEDATAAAGTGRVEGQ